MKLAQFLFLNSIKHLPTQSINFVPCSKKSKLPLQSFISDTLDDILKSQSTFEDSIFIVPSQRASVFIRNEFKRKLSKGFLPEIITIEQLTQRISNIQQVDTIQLLFHFYTIYKELEENPNSFDEFCSWAFVALQDFNEVDQYLVNSQDLFAYLRDIQRMKKWSVKGEFKETELIKDHFWFMEKLGMYYKSLYKSLFEKRIGYQGLIYRVASEKVYDYLDKNSKKSFYFIGFNALNKAEEEIIQSFLNYGNTEIYWDIDQSLLESNHSAGTFIRKYLKEWNYYHDHELKQPSEGFSEKKNIQIIGAPKNVTQLKYTGQLLDQFADYNNTALVLGDESLLSVALNSIPRKVEAINITMGYPLQNIPTSNFIVSIFQLFITQEKLNKKESNEFYYKDVLKVFKNPLMFHLLSEDDPNFILDIQERITTENRSFISLEILEKLSESLQSKTKQLVLSLFEPIHSIEDFINRILQYIENLRSKVSYLEREYLYRFHTAFTQLKNLHQSFGYFQDIKTLFQFYKRVVAAEKLSFQGEPLRGLQLMGMLETRVLDFENVIITSVNEGIVPSNNTQNSFIPFDIKVDFKLPTYREKDAIFSYHFFRLLQRAKNIYLLYNTENDSFGNGEKSRFISQLELMRTDLNLLSLNQKVETQKRELLEVSKDPDVLEKLKGFASKGISPSAIGRYLYNPIEFYKERILGIKQTDEVEETIAANTLGNVVHDTLDELYTPYEGKFLTIEGIQEMKKQVSLLTEKYFAKHFINGDYKTGKNRLIFEVAKKYVDRFLNLEIENLSKGDQIKIIATEQKLTTDLTIDSIDFPVKIRGIVDRIDEYNGTVRIVDYKTGFVNSGNLRFLEIDDHKYEKAIQVMLYALLYSENYPLEDDQTIQAGIYSMRNLKAGYLKVNFSEKTKGRDYSVNLDRIDFATKRISELIAEIFNPSINFKESEKLPF